MERKKEKKKNGGARVVLGGKGWKVKVPTKWAT